MEKLTEQDLIALITEKLKDCDTYANLCLYTATPAGKERIVNRVKEIIYNDGITSIEAALAHVETELIFS